MSTKNTTQTTNAYNPSSMGNYNAFQGQTLNSLMQMVNNPLGNSYFQNQLAQQQGVSNQIGQRNNSNLLQNMRAGGGILSNSVGFAAGALNRNNVGNSMMQGNAFNSALNSALNNRSIASASMAAYQPLQTGQTSTQSQTGLGTWLPQLLGAAGGAAMNLAAPGLGSMMGGGSFSSGYRGGGGSMPPASGSIGGGGGSNPWASTMNGFNY